MHIQRCDRYVSNSSLARFTTRNLLWLMVWCSVLSAIVSAILPRVAAGRQPRFLAAVAAAICVMALAALVALVVRARVERQAGALETIIYCRLQRRDWIWIVVQLGLGVLSLSATVIAVTLDGWYSLLRSGLMYWTAFLMIHRSTIQFWSRGRLLEFCKNGLIYQGTLFIPRGQISDCRWGASFANRLVFQLSGRVRWEIDVDPQQREAVSRALEDYVPTYRTVDRSLRNETPASDASKKRR